MASGTAASKLARTLGRCCCLVLTAQLRQSAPALSRSNSARTLARSAKLQIPECAAAHLPEPCAACGGSGMEKMGNRRRPWPARRGGKVED